MTEKTDLVQQECIGPLNDDHKFLQDNEFIHSGYRLYFNSSKKILKSLFIWHNESFNIWSHLLGFLVFLSFLIYSAVFLHISAEISLFPKEISEYVETSIEQTRATLEPIETELNSVIESKEFDWILPALSQTKLQDVSRWPIFVFIASAMICLSMSSLYHLCSAHSRKMYSLTSRLDYAGISILVCGSFFPPIYYMYFCKKGKYYAGLIILYLTGITFFSMMVFVVSLLPAFQKPRFRCLRGSVFLILGLTAVVPCINLLFLQDSSQFSSGLYCYLCMALCYVVGVLIYIMRFPERWLPGQLDTLGNSHNIWHLFVLSACVFHYFGAIDSYYSRQHLVC